MVDVKKMEAARTASPLYLSDEELRRGIELFFFAYRDLVGGADKVLADQGLGRAHHRAIYFVGRNPGLNVTSLLDILQISKQSLARVLRELVLEGYVRQEANPEDKRMRLLFLTEQGAQLEAQLTARQKAFLGEAFRSLPAEAVEGFHLVLARLSEGRRPLGYGKAA